MSPNKSLESHQKPLYNQVSYTHMTFHGPFLCVKISFHADYAYEYWVHFSATVCNGVEGFFASSRNIYLHSGSEFSMGAEITKSIPFFYH